MALNPLSPEWPKQAADLIDRVVQRFRSTFTKKAVTATNAVVFGLVAAFAGFVAALITVVVGIRALQAYLTWDLGETALWVIGILALVGIALVLYGLVRSKSGVIGLGAFVVVVAGGRWALDIGDAHINQDTAVWISYLVVGGIFFLAGALLMDKRHSPLEG